MLRERRVADLVRVHYWRRHSAASLLAPPDLAPLCAPAPASCT
ncbi:hypothetical protein [Streptomyces sp. SS52]|nr:hypothetical protein [Streptomyces sp. SS52]